MTEESPTFRVGQEVEVTYRARVDSVHTGETGGKTLRLVRPDGSAPPPWGWIATQFVTIEVRGSGLPTQSGLYRRPLPAEEQTEDDYHSDGWEFHYLNSSGNWVDIGWGQPRKSEAEELEGPLLPTPF